MKSTTVALLLANLLLLAGVAGLFFYLSETAEDDSEIEIEPTGEEIATWTVFYSASSTVLPACNGNTMGWLYYVGDDQNFRVCTASGWEVIDLTGPDGLPGVPGEDGMHGIHGIDGVHGTNGQDGVNGTNGTNGTDGDGGQDGLDAPDGKSALVKVSTEPIGNHCEYGGLRVQVGVDDNRNGVLDGNEIDQTEFVCNGAPGSGGNPPPPNVPQGRVTDINFGALNTINAYGYIMNYSSGDLISQVTYQSGDILYFKATDSVLGIELWAYDLSSGNVWMVYDANNGSSSSGALYLYEWNENQALVLDSTLKKWFLFDHVNSTLTEFQHNGCLGNSTGHQGDGGPYLNSALGDFGGVIVDDKLYATHRDGRLGYQGRELWEFDLINGTCTLLDDIRGGTWSTALATYPLDSWPSNFFVENDWVCFLATTGPYGSDDRSYWCHDPANGSTWKLIDTYTAGPDISSKITMIGDTLYFISKNGGGDFDVGVFAYDFSNQTSWLIADNLDCSHFYHNTGSGFSVIDSDIYWKSNENYSNNSLPSELRTDDMQLWKLDLNNGACMQVSNYTGSSSQYYANSGLQGVVYTVVSGTSIIFQMDDNNAGSELWRFETSNNSLWRITDVWAGGYSYDSNPVPIRTIGDTLYFRAYDGQTGIELWAYGMNNGTVWQVIDINRGGPLDSSNPGTGFLVELGSSICFDADDGVHGIEVWCI